MARTGQISREMKEHYTYVPMDAKRGALFLLDAGFFRLAR
jgi:hypothetical protein